MFLCVCEIQRGKVCRERQIQSDLRVLISPRTYITSPVNVPGYGSAQIPLGSGRVQRHCHCGEGLPPFLSPPPSRSVLGGPRLDTQLRFRTRLRSGRYLVVGDFIRGDARTAGPRVGTDGERQSNKTKVHWFDFYLSVLRLGVGPATRLPPTRLPSDVPYPLRSVSGVQDPPSFLVGTFPSSPRSLSHSAGEKEEVLPGNETSLVLGRGSNGRSSLPVRSRVPLFCHKG